MQAPPELQWTKWIPPLETAEVSGAAEACRGASVSVQAFPVKRPTPVRSTDEASVVRPLVRAPPFARNSIVGLMSLCCVLLAAQLLAIVYGLVRNCELMSSEYDKKTALLDTVQAHLASPHHNNATLAVKIMRYC